MSELSDHPSSGFHGPKCWVLSIIIGLLIGTTLSYVMPKPATYSVEQLQEMGKLKKEKDPSKKSEGADQDHKEKEHKEKEQSDSKDEHGSKEDHDEAHGHASASSINAPIIPLFYAIPFAILLLSIALMPFISMHFWEHHFPDFAFILGGIVVSYYLFALNGYTDFKGHTGYGSHKILHVGLEYFQFIALVGSLYVVTGGILVDFKGKGAPIANVMILAFGAVMANVIGTTGAAALLIRAFIRINKHRIQPFHVVLFIFIIANCGGCLTPIGDPPLFLGYLQGVPFTWTLEHCFYPWLFCIAGLLAIFFIMDTLAIKKFEAKEKEDGPDGNTREIHKPGISVAGTVNFVFLAIILFGVFLDQLIGTHGVGAVLQILAATAAYLLSNKEILKANDFNFAPIEEVGFLFVGLFATMVPALDFLGNNAMELGINSPSRFYWATGALSSFLDNAPTYLNFLSAGHGLNGMEMGINADTKQWIEVPAIAAAGGASAQEILRAISMAAVFFGAMTYIGNAPNFMVKAIAESSGVRMPTFFGYILKYSLPILGLIMLPLIWLFFI